MSRLEAIVEDLQSLPPAELEAAAEFVHRLKQSSKGACPPEASDERRRAVHEGHKY